MGKNGLGIVLQRRREQIDTYSIRLGKSRVAKLDKLTEVGKAKGFDVRATIVQAVDRLIDRIGEELDVPVTNNGTRMLTE